VASAGRLDLGARGPDVDGNIPVQLLDPALGDVVRVHDPERPAWVVIVAGHL
jgi:hypothetical protein